jgi:hypothetical protein
MQLIADDVSKFTTVKTRKNSKVWFTKPENINILNCSKTRLSWEMARLWAEEYIASHRAGAAVGTRT